MSRWFRHYAGMMRDEKLVRAAVRSKQPVERVVWVWGAILESAAEINDNGRYEFDAGEAAYFLRVECGEIEAIIAELDLSARLHEGMVARWGDRQYSSDGAAERQRRYRERRKNGDDGDAHNRNGDADVTSRVTSRDAVVTLQETETETETEQEGANAPYSSEPEKSAPSVVAFLPTVSDGDFPFFEADVEEWRKAFPAVDVRQQLAAMRSWLIANPTKRKTKRGMRKFVVAWLDRKQNSGSPPAQNGHSPPNGKRQNAVEAMEEIFRDKGWMQEDEQEFIPSRNGDAQCLPSERRSEQGAIVDLRSGTDWRSRSGH